MKNTQERVAVAKLHAIESAEQYLIARTREELRHSAGSMPVENFAEALYRPVLALGLTVTFVWFLNIGVVSDFLAATI
ncbi:hypothetical protein [Anderseniella sp. Alg231-50]|uniref:hypothetical protein n=1 Tax=Anderseniella sp. Alg231-50 TaxID=1922226 RepID=UPI000D55DED2